MTMTQTLSSEDKYRRAQRAEQLLNDDVFQEMFSELKEEYQKAWEEATTVQDREHFWYLVQALGHLRKGLKVLVDRKLVRDAQSKK